MKNWFRYSLVGMLGIMLLTSCYRDKGNYSYQDLNEISIDLPEIVSVQQGMVLEVSPDLSFALEEDEGNLSYEWVISIPTSADSVNVVLSTDRNFAKRIDYASGNTYPFSFNVTDNNTGITYRKGMELEVRTNYQPGYFVLEQYDSYSDISFYNTKTDTVFHNIFSEVNPDVVLKPNITDLFTVDFNGYSSPNGKVAAGNMTMVFGEDWGYVINYRSCRLITEIEQMFMTRPEVIRPQVLANYIENSSVFVLINNGMIYRMHQDKGQTLFGEPMVASDSLETGCASLIGSGMYYRGQLMGILYYDEIHHRFYSRFQGTNVVLSDVSSKYIVNETNENGAIISSDTLFRMDKVDEAWKLLGMPIGGPGNMYYYMVFKASDHVYTIPYYMAGTGVSNGPLNVVTEEVAPGMGDSPVYVSPMGRSQVYYANGNEIRMYDVLANTSRAIYTFPSGENVVSIVLPTNDGMSLTAATYNGDKGSIYAFTLVNTGDLKDLEPTLLATDFGKIKKIVYKK